MKTTNSNYITDQLYNCFHTISVDLARPIRLNPLNPRVGRKDGTQPDLARAAICRFSCCNGTKLEVCKLPFMDRAKVPMCRFSYEGWVLYNPERAIEP